VRLKPRVEARTPTRTVRTRSAVAPRGKTSETVGQMRVVVLSSVLVLGVGCTSTLWSPHEGEDCESPTVRRVHRALAEVEPEGPTEGPVILTLRTRDHDVVVHGGDDELRFTVAAAEGDVIGRMLNPREFEARFPELFQHFESAFAEESAGERSTPSSWAGL
jgi:hypothetical protein